MGESESLQPVATPPVRVSTVVRTIIIVIAFANMILSFFGINPIPVSEEILYEVISAVVSFLTVIWGWWKNNSFSKIARKADAYGVELMHQEGE